MHGAGNDYVYINANQQNEDWSALAVKISDRHRGVGSDGMIIALPSKHADLKMRMFNSDGSEGEMCGNGIRCLVAFALSNGIVQTNISTVTVETLAGDIRVSPIWNKGIVVKAKVEMGMPKLSVKSIPVKITGRETVINYPIKINGYSFDISCVSMGNPHAVAFVDNPVDSIPLDRIGPIIENNPMFPNRVNFEIVNVLDQSNVKARVWERGSGLTMACGTGACAIGVIGKILGRTGDKVNVSLPGGNLSVIWQGKNSDVLLEGPVEKVFEGEWVDVCAP